MPDDSNLTIRRESPQWLTPRNLTEAMELAKLWSASEIVPKEFRGKPGDILVAIQMGMEVGLSPAQAVQSIAVINGRPTLWGDTALALVRNSGLLVAIEERGADEALKLQEGYCAVQRKNEELVVRKFSVEHAQKAGLWGRQGPWNTYPGRMLQMRARSWAIRDVFPDVLKGLQVREEVEDIREAEVVSIREPMPKKLMEAFQTKPIKDAPIQAEAAKIAEGRTVAPKPEAPPPTDSNDPRETVMVMACEKKSSGGKTWFALKLAREDGTEFDATTWHESIAAKCAAVIGQDIPVKVLIERKEKNSRTFLNIETMEEAK